MKSVPHQHPDEQKRERHEIVQRAFAIVDTHDHFFGRAARFEFDCREDMLVVRGAVPTFYLKQVLQTVLRNVDGVRMIDNQVTVVSIDVED